MKGSSLSLLFRKMGFSIKINKSQCLENEMLMSFSQLCEKHDLKINGVIHIGAHYGEEIGDYVNYGIKEFIFFEPVKLNFQVLESNLKNYDVNFRAHNVALGSKKQKSMMFVSDNERQSSSILTPKVHLTHHPNVGFPAKEEVEVDVLDNYITDGFNFINMDVQGYELEVLKGATKTLDHIQYVYCEVNRAEVYENNAMIEDIDNFLSNYNMKRVETDWAGGIWGDALYVN